MPFTASYIFAAASGLTLKWSLVTGSTLHATLRNQTTGFTELGTSGQYEWAVSTIESGYRGRVVFFTGADVASLAGFTTSNVVGGGSINPGEIERPEKALPDVAFGSTGGLLGYGTGTGQVNPASGNVALSTAANQALAQLCHGFETVTFVAHDGNATTSGTTLRTTIEAATAGTLVMVDAGTFNLASNNIDCPASVSVRGAGMYTTTIVSDVGLTDAIFCPGNYTRLSDLSVIGSEATAYQAPFGGRAASASVTRVGVVAERCRFKSDSDGAYSFATGSEATYRDCLFETKYDCVIASDAQTIRLFNCTMDVIGPSATGDFYGQGIAIAGGSASEYVNLLMVGGTIRMRGASGSPVYRALSIAATAYAKVLMVGVTIWSPNGTQQDVFNDDTNSTVVCVGCVGTGTGGKLTTAGSGTVTVRTGPVNWADVINPTTTLGLTNTTVGTATSAASIATNGISAASIASDAITAAKIADGAITAAKIATNAIDADALATDAVTEIAGGITIPAAGAIADAVWDELLSGHTTAGSAGKALTDAEAGATPVEITVNGDSINVSDE